VTPALPEFTAGRIAASFCPSEVREIGAGPVRTGTHVGHTGREVAWRSKPEAMVPAVPDPPVCSCFLSLSRLVRSRKRAGRTADDAVLTL